MQRPATLDELTYSPEELDLFRKADVLSSLIAQPGWQLVEDRMAEYVANARDHALHADSDVPTVAVNALRQWQIADEFLSSIRAFIHETIYVAKQHAPRNAIEAAILQEQLNVRTDTGSADRDAGADALTV